MMFLSPHLPVHRILLETGRDIAKKTLGLSILNIFTYLKLLAVLEE